MSDAYLRKREFFRDISGTRRIGASDTGTLALVAAIPKHTIYIQRIYVAVTTVTASETWTCQDGAGFVVAPPIDAGDVAQFPFEFGAQGVPLTEESAFNVVIAGATGADGSLTWEGYAKLTLGAADVNNPLAG
jgi:hypothetical protein